MNNPCQTLTPGQRRALDAVIEHLCDKAAATALGLSHKTVAAHLERARLKLNARNRLDLLLKWDRFRRQSGSDA